MKRILITGKNSYVGGAFESWVANAPEKYKIDKIDLKDPNWRNNDFSQYDAIFHVAGIAHSDTGNATEETKKLYYKVNTDLTLETAEKAKAAGVKQFIYMSSMIVYGESNGLKEKKVITKDTIPTPANFYGDSKLQADIGLEKFQGDDFKIVVLRPPMIYGKGSKGNYPRLAKFAKSFPIFPNVDNERSMLHIDNLCEFIRLMIDNEEQGIFFPQNEAYVQTSELVRVIAEVSGKRIRLVKVFNPLLRFFSGKLGVVDKVFGNFVYEKSMSAYSVDYRVRDFVESIERTEG